MVGASGPSFKAFFDVGSMCQTLNRFRKIKGQLMQEEMTGFGTYPALGICKIKKKDIINVSFY